MSMRNIIHGRAGTWLAVLVFIWLFNPQSLMAKPEPADNTWAFEALDEHTFRVRAEISRYHITADENDHLTIECFIPDTIPQLSMSGLPIPRYTHVHELADGRSAVVEDLQFRTRRLALPAAATIPAHYVEENMESPLTVSVGRMGRRAFLRVSLQPFHIDAAQTRITMYEYVEATIRVLDSDPPRARVSEKMQVAAIEGVPFCDDCPGLMPVGVTPGIGSPGDFFPRRSVTNDVAWKIRFTQPGLYRITGQELANAGMPAEYRDTSKLRVVARDQVLPVWTSISGPMQTNDWIMFYGAAVDSQTTPQNVYWLAAGVPSPQVSGFNARTNISAPLVTSAWARVDYGPTNFYQQNYQPLDDSFDHWFAMRVAGGTSSNISFSTPFPVRTGNIYVAYTIHGFRNYRTINSNFTGADHRSQILINTQLVFSRDYTGEVMIAGTIVTNASFITNAATVLTLSQPIPPGVTGAIYATSFLRSLSLCYQKRLVATNFPYYFRAPTIEANMRLKGLPSTSTWLVDVSNPFHPVQWTNLSFHADGQTWNLDLGVSPGMGECLALFGTSSVRSVTSLELVRFRNLADPARQADYLMVVPTPFRQPAYRLLKHRFKNGLSVQVATPDDLYNEFSYGVVDATAIRQYFGYTFHHYAKPEPGYAVLVGNGSYDPLRRTGHTDVEHIPTVQGAANFTRTTMDQWFVTVDGVVLSEPDSLPDIRIGRVPATNVVEMNRFVDKVIAYERSATHSGWFASALLIADKSDQAEEGVSGDFKGFSEANTRVHLQNGGFDNIFGISTVYLDDANMPPATAKNTINSFIQTGVQIVNYMGHGSLSTWSDVQLGGVWNRGEAETRTNTVSYPVFIGFTCRSGAFQEPGSRSLAEAIILSQRCGSACIAPTALSRQIMSEKLADGFYQALAVDRKSRLGDCMEEAQLSLWTFNTSAYELLFYTIFGDPAQQIWGGARP